MNTNRFPVPCFSSDCFSWENKHGVTFASGLGKSFAGRIYVDACDRGFLVRSERTGNSKLFFLCNILKDAQGDITEFCFEDAEGGIKISVFND